MFDDTREQSREQALCDICSDPLSDSMTIYAVVNNDGMTNCICDTCYRWRQQPPNVVRFPTSKHLQREKGGRDDEPFAA